MNGEIVSEAEVERRLKYTNATDEPIRRVCHTLQHFAKLHQENADLRDQLAQYKKLYMERIEQYEELMGGYTKLEAQIAARDEQVKALNKQLDELFDEQAIHLPASRQ